MSEKRKKSTMAALLEEKPKRGRPPRPISRQNVYVALSEEQKQSMKQLGGKLSKRMSRADVPDMAISLLAARFEELRRAVADRDREIPEGIVDVASLYLLWDLPLPSREDNARWTSIRVSPQQAIELGRVHGILNTLLGANRSEVFGLGLALLGDYLKQGNPLRGQHATHEWQEYASQN